MNKKEKIKSLESNILLLESKLKSLQRTEEFLRVENVELKDDIKSLKCMLELSFAKSNEQESIIKELDKDLEDAINSDNMMSKRAGDACIKINMKEEEISNLNSIISLYKNTISFIDTIESLKSNKQIKKNRN